MAKNVVAKLMIDGVLNDVMFRTGADNIIVDTSTNETLSTRLASIVTSLDNVISSSDVDTKISAAIDNLIDGAPETYDTLKEIAEYISAHGEVKTALEEAIAKKVDKEDGKGLSTNDFTDALLEKLNGIADGATKVTQSETNGQLTVNGNDITVYTHPTTSGNKHIPSGGEAGQILGYDEDGTAKWVTPKVCIQSGATVPDTLAEGELFLQIIG